MYLLDILLQLNILMLSFIAVSTRWWKAMVVAVTMASECRRKEMEPRGKMTARKMMHMKGFSLVRISLVEAVGIWHGQT